MNNAITANTNLIEELRSLGTVRVNEPMSLHTTFRTGGPADIAAFPGDVRQAGDMLKAAAGHSVPVTIIGGGSNLLVGDRGIRGLVLVLSEKDNGPGRLELEGSGLVHADATVMKDRFIDFAVEQGLGGVEFMAGIPGCVGGGIVMNAGTFMGSFIDCLVSVEYFDAAGKCHSMEVNRAMSDYRTFRIEKGVLIAAGKFRLPPAGDTVILRKKIQDILEDRRGKHPLDWPSAGSVFKNPPGQSSWQLVDRAGLKGRRVGGAMVSEKHTNFVINRESATSRDIRDLIELIQERVSERFGFSLETEIRMLGEF